MGYLYKRIFYACATLCLCASVASAKITYNKNNDLDFGTVNKQPGVDVTSSVAVSEGGQLTLKDKDKNPPDIKIIFQSDPNSCTTPPSIKVKDFIVKYGSQSEVVFSGEGPFVLSGLPNPGKSGEKLQYGATVVVTKDAPSGANTVQHPCYHIQMEYDCVSGSSGCPSVAEVVANLKADVKVLGIPVVLSESQSMDFGHITSPTRNSRIVLQPDGNIDVTNGNVILLDGGVGKPSIFNITSEKNVGISVYASPGAAVSGISLSNMRGSFNGANMPNGVNINNAGNAKNFQTSVTGNDTLAIGARLNVPKNVSSGAYSLGYDVIIDYQ